MESLALETRAKACIPKKKAAPKAAVASEAPAAPKVRAKGKQTPSTS